MENNLTSQNRSGLLLFYQISTFIVLFLGYASYTYNRKSASFAAPTLLAAGLLTKSKAGKIHYSYFRIYHCKL